MYSDKIDFLNRVARHPNRVLGRTTNDVSADALLSGWLHVKIEDIWQLRYCQLRKNRLDMVQCDSLLITNIRSNAEAFIREAPVQPVFPFTSYIGLDNDFGAFIKPQEAKILLELWSGSSNLSVGARYSDGMFVTSSAEVPKPALFRTTKGQIEVFEKKDSDFVFLADNIAIETGEIEHELFPFGLEISSNEGVHLLIVAAPTPIVVLQWMGALRETETLDKPRKGSSPRLETQENLGFRGSRLSRSNSLLNAMLTHELGNSDTAMNRLSQRSEETVTAKVKENLIEGIQNLPWKASNPPTLEKILDNELECQLFVNFCATIFAEESVKFVLRVRKYKLNPSVMNAHKIVTEFVYLTGKSVVSFDEVLRKKVMKDALTGSVNVFDEANLFCMHLIRTDSLVQFINRVRIVQPDEVFDSDDSSSFEERKRTDSLGNIPASDFGSFGGGFEDTSDIHQHIRDNFEFDPKHPPTFHFLLAKKKTRALLQKFAKTTLCEENILFWEKVQYFKLIGDPKQRKETVEVLFTRFIDLNSLKVVNIAGSERAKLMKKWETIPINELIKDESLFDLAITELVKVMELDLYPKFMNIAASVEKETPKPKTRSRANSPRSRGNSAPTSRKGSRANSDSAEAMLTRAPPLYDILNDLEELQNLLVFASTINHQDDVLFWCMVQNYKGETNQKERERLGKYLIKEYVDHSAPHFIRCAKPKMKACISRFETHSTKGKVIPLDLFDALVKDVQKSMQKNLHPSYDKFLRRSERKKKVSLRSQGKQNRLLQDEVQKAKSARIISEKSKKNWTTSHNSAPGSSLRKKGMFLGTRRKK